MFRTIGFLLLAISFTLFAGCEKAEKLHIAVLEKGGLTDKYPVIELGVGSVSGFVEDDRFFSNLDHTTPQVGYVTIGDGCRVLVEALLFGDYSAKLDPILIACKNGRLMYDISGSKSAHADDISMVEKKDLMSSAYIDLRFYNSAKHKITFQIKDHRVVEQFYGKVKDMGDNFFQSYVGSYSTTGDCSPVDGSRNEVVAKVYSNLSNEHVCYLFQNTNIIQTQGFIDLLRAGFPKKNGDLYREFNSRFITST